MKQLKVILIFVFLSTILCTCGKYPDGPWFTLRTKMSRITGEALRNNSPQKSSWGINKYLVNGVDSTQALLSRTTCEKGIQFDRPKGGTTYCSFGCPPRGAYWWLDKKEAIVIDRLAATTTTYASYPPMWIGNYLSVKWYIQRLTMKQMWLRTTVAGDEYYIELKR